jgi:dihydrodipicolinate synthase/N-acetylneuraminate lyase
MRKIIQGVLPVILSPFDDRFEIDESDFKRQVDHVLGCGCDGFVVGQVSELLRLTTPERHRLTELCVEAAAGRCITVMSTGGESTKAAIDYSRFAERAGIDALLVMHPSIVALDDAPMFAYFADVIQSVSVPVIIHHAKSFAKRPLSTATQARLLAEFGPEKVLFKPEASPTPPRVSELLQLTGGKARIFEGDGGMMLIDCYERGLAGTIPATEIAEIVVVLWRLLERGEKDKARRIGYRLAYLMCHMMNSIDCYLSIAKMFLKTRGIIKTTNIRGPVEYSLDAQTRSEVMRVYEELLILSRELSPISKTAKRSFAT